MTTTDDLETTLFLQALEGRFGVDFTAFDAAGMRRKLAQHAVATGAVSISALQGRILRDEALGAQVIRMLNRSGPSSLADVFHVMALRCAVLPILRSSPWPAVWLADCSSLRELVLFVLLLKEEGLFERTRVFITSSSEHTIEELRSSTLSAADVDELQTLHRGSGGRTDVSGHLQGAGDAFVLDPALHNAVSWHVHNLATDASFGEFQAIVAPRPLNEYGRALRERVVSVFGRSLCPFGILQIDDKQAARPPALGHRFSAVLPSYGIYRRTADK